MVLSMFCFGCLGLCMAGWVLAEMSSMLPHDPLVFRRPGVFDMECSGEISQSHHHQPQRKVAPSALSAHTLKRTHCYDPLLSCCAGPSSMVFVAMIQCPAMLSVLGCSRMFVA